MFNPENRVEALKVCSLAHNRIDPDGKKISGEHRCQNIVNISL
jgi:hypothetical protein